MSDGSPGSALAMVGVDVPLFDAASALAIDRVRARFCGGLVVSIALDTFLYLLLDVGIGAAESSASSPDASRDDGWRRSAVDDCLIEVGRVVVRFRLLEPAEEGDDISSKRTRR